MTALTETILLDYAGVITRDYHEVDYPAELASKFGISTEAFVRTNRQHSAMARLSLGELSESEVSDLFVSQNADARPIEPLEFVSDNYNPDPETLERLAAIRSKGLVRLALVSNIFPASIQYLRQHGVDTYFDHTFFSCEMGDRKPNESYFSTVLAACRIRPSAALFLDDTLSNIETAEKLGIPSILISDRHQVHEILDGFIND